MAKLKVVSLFAGVGGIDLGFEKTGHFKTIYANENDLYPATTFEENFNIVVDKRDICDLKPKDIPDCDVIIGGFPCQAFSIAGYQQGFEDEKGRGTLFFEMLRLIKAKRPKIIFIENVKNLVSHDKGNTYRVISEALKASGYYIEGKVMNAMNYGNIPQNRERIYIVGFSSLKMKKEFDFPDPIELTTTLDDIIDFNNEVDNKYYYTKRKYKGGIYGKLVKATKDDTINNRSIYQWRRSYVRKNQSHVVPTLTANQGEGGHNVCLLKTNSGKFRKMTPHECFNSQGFPKDFILPENMSDARLYKQAGNSVCVTVIERIADSIYSAYIEANKKKKNK